MSLSFTDMLTETFNLYFKNFSKYLKVVLSMYVLPNFVLYLILFAVFGSLGLGMGYVQDNVSQSGMIALGVMGGAALAVFIVLLMLIYFVMAVSIIKLTIHIKNGKNPKISQLFHESIKYLGQTVQFSIILFSIAIGLSLVFVAPGLTMIILELFGSVAPGIIILVLSLLIFIPLWTYLRTNWAFSFFSIVVDNVPAVKALRHSKNLVKGNWWRVFGYNFLFGLILSGAIMVVYIPLIFFSIVLSLVPVIGPILNNILSDMVTATVLPLSYIFVLLFYNNLKLSKKPKKVVKTKK